MKIDYSMNVSKSQSVLLFKQRQDIFKQNPMVTGIPDLKTNPLK